MGLVNVILGCYKVWKLVMEWSKAWECFMRFTQMITFIVEIKENVQFVLGFTKTATLVALGALRICMVLLKFIGRIIYRTDRYWIHREFKVVNGIGLYSKVLHFCLGWVKTRKSNFVSCNFVGKLLSFFLWKWVNMFNWHVLWWGVVNWHCIVVKFGTLTWD